MYDPVDQSRYELMRDIRMGAVAYLKTGQVDADLETAVEEVHETMSLEKLLSLILTASDLSTVKDEVEKYIAPDEKVWSYMERQDAIARENHLDAIRYEQSLEKEI